MSARAIQAAALPLILAFPGRAVAQSEIIDGWTDLLHSTSRLVIVLAAFLGLGYVAVSLLGAYRAEGDDARTRHLLAAIFAGSFTIIGVFIGWVSGLLAPGAG